MSARIVKILRGIVLSICLGILYGPVDFVLVLINFFISCVIQGLLYCSVAF